MVPFKQQVPQKVLKYGAPKPSYSTPYRNPIETLIDPFKEPEKGPKAQ